MADSRTTASRRIPTIVTARFGGPGLAGQGEYERQLVGRLQQARGVRIADRRFEPLRARGAGRRIPVSALMSLPTVAQAATARWLYGPASLVHRMDARLPAARHELLTIHDVSPLRFDDEGPWPPRCGAHRALAVVTPSSFAAREVEQVLGVHHAVAIANGLDPACADAGPLDARDRAALGGMPDRFVLVVGGSTERKNLPALADAWRRLLPTLPEAVGLVVAGPPSTTKDELFGNLARCRLVGNVDRPRLLRMLTSASALVVPSLYEGFGLPVLEAMAAGTLVVCARTSALVEVAGEAAFLVEPDGQGLAAGIVKALAASADHRRVDAGRQWTTRFSWDRAAEAHLELYDRLLTGPGRR